MQVVSDQQADKTYLNRSVYTAAFEKTVLHKQPYTDGHADKPEFTSAERCDCVSCFCSSQWIPMDNDGDWSRLYCASALYYMGMRTTGNLPFVELLIFCIITEAMVHWRAESPEHTHSVTHTSSSCAREGALPLQSPQCVHKANGRRRQIRGGDTGASSEGQEAYRKSL